tara:strand:+ start:186 stop:842 length:657 start_codon:yes stop_codon:yes gene_type:complete
MNKPQFLHQYFLNNGGKRLHKWVHYFDIYQKHFDRFVGRSPVMLEIGVFGGGSLEMWKNYFGKGSQIIGLDINPECKQHESEGIEIFIGSQDDETILDLIKTKYPNIDIILDDGSHVMSHMNKTFTELYDFVDPNGIYMVEDTHTCYWDEYEGGVGKENSFTEISKALVDELNAVHTRNVIPTTEFTKTTQSISFYDSIIVFEKAPQGNRQAPITGAM